MRSQAKQTATNADLAPGEERVYRGYLIARHWPVGTWFFVTKRDDHGVQHRIATTETLTAAMDAVDSLFGEGD